MGECATETSQELDPGLPDIPEESETPDVVVPRPPSPNIISEAMPAVGYACVPLAREGPFLEERSADSIRSLGPGCAFRNTTYRASDYAEPAGEYGLLLNHPRFLEWIRIPQSAGLLELSGRQWVDRLSRGEAVTAAVHPQRDVGLMQTKSTYSTNTPHLSKKRRLG